MKVLIGPCGTTAYSTLLVRFSVMMAFRYRGNYQMILKMAKNSTMAIFFRETKMEAGCANVYLGSDLEN